MRTLLAVALLTVAACSKPITAADACAGLEKAGVAAACKADKPSGLGANARERVTFDLPSVPGKTGQVLSFADDAAYDDAVKGFDAAKALAGPHRYGSKGKRIFVQFNDGASMETGAKARAYVDAL